MYCVNVTNKHVEKYSWYCMPQRLHRILSHGLEVVRQFSLPVRLLSKEAH